MKFARFAYSTLGLITAGSLAWGCSSKSSDCSANKDCGAFGGVSAAGSAGKSGSSGSSGMSVGGDSGGPGDAGQGGSTGNSGSSSGGNAGSGGAACDGAASPDATDCVIGDDYGLFVSLSGDDSAGDGSEAHPLATVTKALSLTGPNKLNRIYVCATPTPSATAYAEPDTVVIPDRVSIYGGFTCDGGVWAYDTTVAAHLKPASPVGAQIDSAKNGVLLQDLRIDATAAPEDGTGASSFGMIVNASKGVVLTRVEIHAGKGGGGAAGADGMMGADGSGTAGIGTTGSCDVSASAPGGKAAPAVCGSSGGDGGSGAKGTVHQGVQDGLFGLPQDTVDPPQIANGGVGASTVGTSHLGTAGSIGSFGLPGSPGARALPVGLLSAGGYAKANGGDGAPGSPGQGGGGGGASLGKAACVGSSGGAGGMGGCGGDPGKGGVGGGASVALLSWNSVVVLDGCMLVASAGGAGGSGGKAHPGGAGAPGGAAGPIDTGDGIAAGGKGGDGGGGGIGGSGAGGTGGPSIALVYAGSAPTKLNSPTLSPGSGGAHGAGGHFGSDMGNWGPDGSDGLSQAEYEQK